MRMTDDATYLYAIELACNRLAADILEKYGDAGREMLVGLISGLEEKIKRSMN